MHIRFAKQASTYTNRIFASNIYLHLMEMKAIEQAKHGLMSQEEFA